jgi:Ca2+-binding EF-hand superfamily protein
MSIEDLRICFDTLDYTKDGEVDFSEFCLINTDTTNNVH